MYAVSVEQLTMRCVRTVKLTALSNHLHDMLMSVANGSHSLSAVLDFFLSLARWTELGVWCVRGGYFR